MTPYTFDSDVPPLNTRCGASSASANRRPSNQQTQKSFSTITLDVAMRAAVCAKARAWRFAGSATNCDASFGIAVSVRGERAQSGLHPARRQRQVVQQRLPLIGRDRTTQSA